MVPSKLKKNELLLIDVVHKSCTNLNAVYKCLAFFRIMHMHNVLSRH